VELTWWPVAILGMVAAAACLAAALLWPWSAAQRALRPMANTARLTRLPEYRRAVRLRAISAAVTVTLLAVTFTAAVVAAARPTGGPTLAPYSASAAPEDVMVCVGAPLTDPGAREALGFFAEAVPSFGAARIGLTSPNRRVVPMTRDHQFAAAQFADHARPVEQQGDSAAFARPVSYVDYTQTVPDLIHLCLTGFPQFDQRTPQRRSLIYVGPGALGSGPSLFTADQVTETATRAGVQINAVVTGAGGDLVEMTAATGGRMHSADTGVREHLADIRRHPPGSAAGTGTGPVRAVETPDVPLTVGLVALLVLALWPVVMRR
jgi:hypothetical protein